MDRLTVGQMAKLNNISKQTLRFYDKIDLLKPDIIDEENGYRYYSIKQSAYLDMIQYMKALGMELKDIKVHLQNRDASLMKSILTQRGVQIDQKILELKNEKRAVEHTLQSYERYENSPPDGAIVLEYIDKRYMYCIDSEINFYGHGIEVYEEMLRKLKMSLISDNLSQVYFCNAGTILRQENLEKRKLFSSEIFVFVDKEHVSDKLTLETPASTYLCIYCNEFDKEEDYIDRLMHEVEEKGYTIVGDYICEVLAEFPLLERKERGMFFRLQVPIKFG